MFLIYSLLSSLFTGHAEERKPRPGETIRFVQAAPRNAYDGYCGTVNYVAHGADGYYGFSIWSGSSTLNCFGFRYERHYYRLPGNLQVYKW